LLLTIEKMIYGGDGLARLAANDRGPGKAAFVPFVLEGEEVEVTISEEKPGYVRARAEQIVSASPQRAEPQCPYFAACGGCHYQHVTYEHQLEIKREILRESVRRFAKLELECEIEVHPSPPWNYRNRSRLQIRARPEFAAGYFRFGSHNLMPVEECPISSPLINRALAALWQLGRRGKAAEGAREIEFFANADDTKLLVEIGCAPEARRAAVRAWAEELRVALPEISGVVAFRAAPVLGPGAAQEKFLSLGETSLTCRTQTASFRVSAGAFFQTNRHLTDQLVNIVTQHRRGELALDLYAGVGLFSTALAGDFHHVVAVESSHLSTIDLAYNLSSKGEVISATAEQYLGHVEKKGRAGAGNILRHELYTPDLAVVDPPRSGLGKRVAKMLADLGARRITYVSCDPATLARDLAVLLAAGYRVDQAHLVDLFPQTYRLESVLSLTR
jgi:23S rRNA (uracil1939-C5)-methyltransferase